MKSAPDAPAALAVDLACFEIAGQTYAVEIERVREILATPVVTRLPDAPAAIEGVIDLRGALIPVLDLAAFLAPASAPRTSGTRMFVVVVRDGLVGFRVERATHVVRVARESLEAVPGLLREAGCDAVAAAVRRDQRPPIFLLDLGVLVERVVRAPAAAGSLDGPRHEDSPETAEQAPLRAEVAA